MTFIPHVLPCVRPIADALEHPSERGQALIEERRRSAKAAVDAVRGRAKAPRLREPAFDRSRRKGA